MERGKTIRTVGYGRTGGAKGGLDPTTATRTDSGKKTITFPRPSASSDLHRSPGGSGPSDFLSGAGEAALGSESEKWQISNGSQYPLYAM